MDLEYWGKVIAVVSAVGTTSFAAIQAGLTWLERTRELRRKEFADRAAELGRLHEAFKGVSATFAEVVDYATSLDKALRLKNLVFSQAEAATRTRVDAAFEFLRTLHTSVRLGLIERTELGPWTYWIHRIDTRPPLMAYSQACAYEVFRLELRAWTADSPEVAMLKKDCPWWGLASREPTS